MARMNGRILAVCVAALLVVAADAQSPASDGKALFDRECATCHTGEAGSRAPAREVLRERSPEAILFALTAGGMRPFGAHLSGIERRAVAEYLSGKPLAGDVTGATTGRCPTTPVFTMKPAERGWSGWSPTTTNTRFQSAAGAGLTAADIPRLTLKWAFGFPDATSAWAQPAVIGGRVFVGSQNGTVYSLDAATGCIYWTFSAQSSVRTGVTIAPRTGGGFAAYFGDTFSTAYALDASTGALLWSRKVDAHPVSRITGTPTLHGGLLYVPTSSFEETTGANPQYECCTFRGSVAALDAASGRIVWQTYMVPEPKERGKSSTGRTLWGPSGAGIWNSPTIDEARGVLYVATGNAYSGPQLPTSDAVIALDLRSGAIRWTLQVTPKDVFIAGCRPGNPNCTEDVGPDFDFGNSAMLVRTREGKDLIVIGQKSGVAYAMDPDRQGAVVWQYRAGEGSALGGLEWGSAVDDENAYFPNSDIVSQTPGGLHAVNLVSGQRVWHTPPPPPKCGSGRGCNAAQPAAATVIPGVVFSGSNDGALRAFSTRDGSIVWEYDTNRSFDTVNGVPAKGASMHGPGPTVAGGRLYVNSGYGDHGGRPGNVLLVFEPR
jgi:polyvinyl alcohol dehydrogenase (cytochrome)